VAGELQDLYRRWLLELWHGQLEVADEIIAEDFRGHWPDQEVEGLGALVELIGEAHSQFARLEFELEVGPIVEGDLMAARWSGVGQTGDDSVPIIGHDVMRVRDGRISEYWVVSWMPS
jgi:predicted SnoaL-like aldol condensation-catalyzing enzyme